MFFLAAFQTESTGIAFCSPQLGISILRTVEGRSLLSFHMFDTVAPATRYSRCVLLIIIQDSESAQLRLSSSADGKTLHN